MDLKQLKELAKKLGGILVMDGGLPEFVVLSYQRYSELEEGGRPSVSAGASPAQSVSEDQLIDKLNTEIAALKEEIRQKEEAELVGQEGSPQEIPLLEAMREEFSDQG